MKNNWFKLVCNNAELQLMGTLNGGQSFRWKKHPKREDEWIGVFSNRVWVLKQEDPNSILYQVHENNTTEQNNSEILYNDILRKYFRLRLNLTEYYDEWSKSDKYFAAVAQKFYGIRILEQDVVENIFSFICSSNNHITRISSMVEKLAKLYGEEICEVEGETYYSFPTVQALSENTVEEMLQLNGFGYRSKYISKSAKLIVEQGGDEWINNLKNMEYKRAKKTLMTLTGIGAKVADCICLMSLGHLQAIPVDTHVYQIAKRLYMPNLPNNKTVTEKVYNDIGNHFRLIYGPLAGWAHTVLFCADLKKFQGNDGDEENDKSNKKLKTKR